MSVVVGQLVAYHWSLHTVTGYNTGGRVVLLRGRFDDPQLLAGWRLYGPWYNTPPGAFSIDESELERNDDA